MARNARQRTVLVVSVLACAGLLAVFGERGFWWAKAHRASTRIERDLAKERPRERTIRLQLSRLSTLDRPEAIPFLQRYVYDLRLRRDVREEAARFLLSTYPESSYARSIRRYRELTNRQAYFDSTEATISDYARTSIRRLRVDESQASGLRQWLLDYPKHPGSDDAYIRIAAFELSRKRIRETLNVLHAALHAGDRDKHLRAGTNLRYVLDRDANSQLIEAWAEGVDCKPIQALAWVSAAVHSMREGDPARAVSFFDRALADRVSLQALTRWVQRYDRRIAKSARSASPGDVPDSCLGNSNVPRLWIENELAKRRADASFIATQTAEHRDGDRWTSAEALYAVASRIYHAPNLYSNFFVDPMRRWRPESPTTLLEALQNLPLDRRNRHAGVLFGKLCEQFPDAPLREKAEYSMAVALWRLTQPSTNARWAPVLAKSFLAFADRFPQSSMADEALYQASVQLRAAQSSGEEAYKLLQRIAREYPDGNIVKEQVARNEALKRAVREATAIAAKSPDDDEKPEDAAKVEATGEPEVSRP
ncbi:MAG: hypothetical protein AAF517_19015 [Planctomycetota bacterium]